MSQFSANKIIVLHSHQPTRPDWFVCKHFQSVDNMINYYKTLGGITLINRTIVCEDCYEKILTGGWKDVSAACHVLDEKSFRKIFSTIAFLDAEIDEFD